MNNTAVTLQTSKKILIFLYLICIFIFLFFSTFFLYLKSENFRKNLDARLIGVLNENGRLKVTYEGLDGDPLSKIEIFAVNARPAKSDRDPFDFHFSSSKASLVINPLSHILSYLGRRGIPLEFNMYASRFVYKGETAEVGVLGNKAGVTMLGGVSRVGLTHETAFDLACKYIKTSQSNQITVKGESEIDGGLKNSNGRAAARNLSLYFPGLAGNCGLSYSQAGADIYYRYEENGKTLELYSSEVRLNGCSVNIERLAYSFFNGDLNARIKVCGFDTEPVFRAFPVAKLLVMSASAEIELNYKGNISDLRGGGLDLRALFTKARLLEYNVEDNRVFTDIGAGDFVTSLGLSPELVANAQTVEALITLKSRALNIERLRIKAPDYTFKASAAANDKDMLDGRFTLSIPRRILKNNTLKADFSGMPKGLKIYGKIMGDIYNPLIIYDMDGAAILKITEGVMYDKFKNLLGK
ncbi:MAG TPA: hypothetical protein PKL57_08030 [Candidatus Wallbacteria bacterium]|nr:hypothetical protein [Candidatus Wallbacteria bacterium]